MVYDFDILLKIDLQNLFYLEVRYIYLEYLHFFASAIAIVFVFQVKIFQTFALSHYEPIKSYHFSLFFHFSGYISSLGITSTKFWLLIYKLQVIGFQHMHWYLCATYALRRNLAPKLTKNLKNCAFGAW